MNKTTRFLALVISLAVIPSIHADDIVSEFMKGKVATFMDAASLLYYSFQGATSKDKKNQKNNPREDARKHSPEEIKRFLQNKGVAVSLDSRPITRKEFAKTLIDRFNLKTSYLTDIFGGLDSYFEDAVDLGIFSEADSGNENLTTRELLSAYLKAEKMSKRHN